MSIKDNIVTIFPTQLFWDMDYNKLDLERDKDILIPRALFASTLDTFESDIKILEDIYSKNEILNTLKTTKERISNTVCELVAKRYHAKKFARFAI